MVKDYFRINYLENIISSCRCQEHLGYHTARKGLGMRMNTMTLDGKLQFSAKYKMPLNKDQERKWAQDPQQVEFPIDKVDCLKARVGEKNAMKVIGRFNYDPKCTQVWDVDNLKTVYYHDQKKIHSIEYYNDKEKLHSKVKFLWHNNRLQCKVMCDQNDHPLFAKTFKYDKDGNVVEEILLGNLTGSLHVPFIDMDTLYADAERYKKTYHYSQSHLLILEEEDNGLSYRYTYKPNTDLLISKFTCDGDKIFIREFFLYDDDNLLIEQIVDDGSSTDSTNTHNVTQRTIKHYERDSDTYMPVIVSELYWDPNSQEERLLKRTKLTYSLEMLVIKEEVYDAANKYRYTIYTDYDAYGHIIKKTTPTGLENTYTYDATGNLTYAKEVGQLGKTYTYDAVNRPTSCSTKSSLLSWSKTTYNTYDAKGRLLSKTDQRGNKTDQIYDCFGNCIETQFAESKDENGGQYYPYIEYTYDIEGNLASYTTPKGEKKTTSYNLYRKPVKEIKPDKSITIHIYDKAGCLVKTILPDGTQEHYTHDLFQRMTSKTIITTTGEIVREESWDYSSFQLTAYTDPSGLTTHYSYDGAGRKTQEETEGRKKLFFYDSLGFLEKIIDKDVSYITKKDEEGRPIEQWEEDDQGYKENNMWLYYDEEGRKKQATRTTSQGYAYDYFTFDAEGRLTYHKDPLGYKTYFSYEDYYNDLKQYVLQKTTTDPLGNITVETYNALDHLICIEKKNPNGKTVSKEELFYDRAGNKSKSYTTIYVNGEEEASALHTRWEYDDCGRLIKQIEAERKSISYQYDSRGRCIAKNLPDGVAIFYSYDVLNRMVQQLSSDGSIHYQYVYDKHDQPISIIDVVNSHRIDKKYNLFGEIIEETHSNGIKYAWEYDEYGRCICFTLPDHSSIEYTYSGRHMTKVIRNGSNGTYEHNYTYFDSNGHVIEEYLPHNLGKIKTYHDLLERPYYQTSYYLTHSVTYGPSGLVTRTDNSLFGRKDYDYDALNQLTLEKDTEYNFDSVGNPSHYKMDNLNQVLSTPEESFIYDENGQPIERVSSHGKTQYKYDALGRLIAIINTGRKVCFKYDGLSRILSKQVFHHREGFWQDDPEIFYLHDQNYEIGTCDEALNLLSLKVLGLGIKGDIGAAVAIELDNDAYVPLHDLNGHIIGLLSSSGELVESYDMDAFGREKASSHTRKNPWRFSSKRHEEELVLFKERFYDLKLGRWLTPDPAGFVEGINLYLFVLNNPPNRLDLFGLLSDDRFPEHFSMEGYIGQLPLLPSMNSLVLFKYSDGKITVDTFVHSNQWHQCKFNAEELKSGKFNLFDHFHELMPKEGTIIGLITLQNGINTSFREFKEMGQSVMGMIPEGTTMIGLHTPHTFEEASSEISAGKDTPMIALTRQFMEAIVGRIDKINPGLLWTHIGHSGGGGRSYLAIKGMNEKAQKLVIKHLLYVGIAPSLSLPEEYAFRSWNMYSEKDYVTNPFARMQMMQTIGSFSGGMQDPIQMMNEQSRYSNCNIQIIPCVSKWSERSGYFADHAFMGRTYQRALTRQIQDLRNKYGFYDGKNR